MRERERKMERSINPIYMMMVPCVGLFVPLSMVRRCERVFEGMCALYLHLSVLVTAGSGLGAYGTDKMVVESECYTIQTSMFVFVVFRYYIHKLYLNLDLHTTVIICTVELIDLRVYTLDCTRIYAMYERFTVHFDR